MSAEDLTLEEKACNHDTWRHINRVQQLLAKCITALVERLLVHDQSKLSRPEVTIFADTEVWDATGESAVRLDSIRLAQTGVSEGQASELRGGTAELNAKIARDVFGGKTDGPLQAVRDAVVLNTAASLVAWDAANGLHSTGDITARVMHAMPRAQDAIDSGAVSRLLDRWAAVSSEAAR